MMLLCGPQGCWSGRCNGWRWLAWNGVVRGSNKPDDQKNGRTPVGTSPVGLHHASLRTACGRGGIKGSVAHESKDGVFVRGVHTLILKNFGCADAVGIAGLGLHVFHGFIGRQSPGGPHGFPWGHPEDSSPDEMPTARPMDRDVKSPLATPRARAG